MRNFIVTVFGYSIALVFAYTLVYLTQSNFISTKSVLLIFFGIHSTYKLFQLSTLKRLLDTPELESHLKLEEVCLFRGYAKLPNILSYLYKPTDIVKTLYLFPKSYIINLPLCHFEYLYPEFTTTEKSQFTNPLFLQLIGLLTIYLFAFWMVFITF
jgi:hypothetical protein